MSVQVVGRNHYQELLYILENTEEEIRIVSPFIKDETANLLCAVLLENPDIHCTIITRFVRQEFANKASSLLALKHLHESGATVDVTPAIVHNKSSHIIGRFSCSFQSANMQQFMEKAKTP